MPEPDFRAIGRRFADAFHLEPRPLAVYGSESPPPGIVHLSKVNRCFAVSLYRIAAGREVDGLYATGDEPDGCCAGGLAHMGFSQKPDEIKYFVSTGRKDVRGGAAEYLKSSPEMVEKCFSALGRITPPGRYLVVQACAALPRQDPGVRSICCFGSAEQVRNMAALVHFDRDDPFSPVIVPWGPSCSTFITYPAGMAEHAPARTAFVGPQDPTQNRTLPPGMMAIGIPAGVALEMAANLDNSFVVKRSRVAFPDHRDDLPS
ncbi:MAG: DUF169 domain-containing protein [Methanoregulaceae archaeon]|nr:DUF169 domain-containing protein [Methanoregulaceae archaeon]